MQALGLALFVALILTAIRWGVRGCLSWLFMILIGWAMYDAARRAVHDAIQRLTADLASDVNALVGTLSIAAVISGRAAGAVVVASVALDVAEWILRLRNVQVQRDTSLTNLLGAAVSALNVFAKTVMFAGLAGGGPQVTAVGIGLAITAEILKAALLHTNSVAEYRALLLDLWDFVRNLGRSAS